MIRFLHAADLHLDSPLRGLALYEGCPVDQMRLATRRAFENLVDLALRESVQFVVIAGDVFDGDWPDYNTGLYFNAQLMRLRDASIPVVLISGNHDAQNKMTKDLRLPDNVTRLDSRKPQTLELPSFAVAIHGQGFKDQHVYDDLSQGYSQGIPGLVNIGLLHTSLTGADGHAPYAPCNVDGLRSKGYDYWALGHVHTRAVVCTDPVIIFPGNIQGRNIRETDARGCFVVDVEPGDMPRFRFESLDVARWENLVLDAQTFEDPDDLLSGLGKELEKRTRDLALPMALRVHVQGNARLQMQLLDRRGYWTEEIRNVANQYSNGNCWIEKVELQTSLGKIPPPSRSPVKFEENASLMGPWNELKEVIQVLRDNPDKLLELTEGWDDWKTVSTKFKELSGEEMETPVALLAEVEAFLQAELAGDLPT
jgi:DNA repair protein SbcD/Mre11